jgi:hypothetical protein
MSQPAPTPTEIPPTHVLQQKLLQNVASLEALADARKRGDDAAAEALLKTVHDELVALAGAADAQNKAEPAQKAAG